MIDEKTVEYFEKLNDKLLEEQESILKEILKESDPIKRKLIELNKEEVIKRKKETFYKEIFSLLPNQVIDIVKKNLNIKETDYNGSLKDYLVKKLSSTTSKRDVSFITLFSNFAITINSDKAAEIVNKVETIKTTTNEKIKPLTNSIEEALASPEFNALSEDDKTKTKELLDEVNNLVLESSNDYKIHGMALDTGVSAVINDQMVESYNTYVNKENLSDFVEVSRHGVEMSLTSKVQDNEEVIDKINRTEFKLSNDTKEKIKNFYTKVKATGLLNKLETDDKTIDADPLRRVTEAKKNIETALKKHDFKSIDAYKEDYKKSYNEIEGLLNELNKEFSPSWNNFCPNMQNVRDPNMPAAFNDNLPLQAAFISIYNTFMTLETFDVSIDEFLNKPTETINKMTDIDSARFNVEFVGNEPKKNTVFLENPKDLSVEDKIVELLKIKETKKSYRPEIERMITNLSNLEVDENLLDSNNVYFGLYKSKINISSVENIESYFDEGKEQTINNLLFGYIGTDDSLQAYVSHDSVSYDNLNKIKAFDFVNFIQKNNIDEKMLYGRITNLLKKSEGVIPADDMTKMVKGIQKGLVSYFMVKGYNPEVESQKDLYEIITKPSEALKGIIKTNVRAFEEGNFLEDNKEIAIDNLNTKIEEVENSEKAFNRSIKGIKDKNTLENLKKQEVNRLRLECAKGELPKEYYTKRIANIINGNYKKNDALKVLKPKEPNGWHKFVRYFFKKDAYQDVYDNFASRTKELEKFAVKDFLKESEYCSVGNDEEFNLTAKDVNKGERENIEVSQAEMLNNKDQISKYFEPELDVLKKEAVKDEQVR